jgi:hypothetical protein
VEANRILPADAEALANHCSALPCHPQSILNDEKRINRQDAKAQSFSSLLVQFNGSLLMTGWKAQPTTICRPFVYSFPIR